MKNDEGECRSVADPTPSIPLREKSKTCNMSCSSSWFALVIDSHSCKPTGADAAQGIRALEFYDPVAKKHGQAHMQARLGITRWLIKEGIARVEEIRDTGGTLENLYIRVGFFEVTCPTRTATYYTTPA